MSSTIALRLRSSAPGRSAADPAIQLALWLLATVDGIGSARELERCCRGRLPYMWLRDGVPVNYHGLADFRMAHADVLDDLLTKHLAVLVTAEIVSLELIVVDPHLQRRVAAVAGQATRGIRRVMFALGEVLPLHATLLQPVGGPEGLLANLVLPVTSENPDVRACCKCRGRGVLAVSTSIANSVVQIGTDSSVSVRYIEYLITGVQLWMCE